MKNYLCSVALLIALLGITTLTSCNKEESFSIVVPSGSILLTMPGQTGSTNFDTYNISSIVVTSKPNGWSVDNIDVYNGTITVTAPSTFDDEEEINGNITLLCYTPMGSKKSITIYVAILQNTDIDYYATPANCYIANKPETRYKFNPYIGGSHTPLDTQSVEILWESEIDLIKYLDLRDGVASFYLDNTYNEDDEPLNKVNPGNALIGARNADGEIIWSWHIWVTNSDPTAETITLDGRELMNINLGADCNNNGKADPDKIKRSYGLYYQWGRKDPLIGPYSWEFDRNTDKYMYLPDEKTVKLQYMECSAECGNLAWTTSNPISIIKGNPDNAYDWLYASHDTALWSTSSKSENDPCPAGWRVPDSSIFESLTIAAADDEMNWQQAQLMYGWHLEDTKSGEKHFFSAAGRRNYLDGRLDNINNNAIRPVPWSGYYWTTSVDGDMSIALYFDLNTDTRTWNSFNTSRSMQRANALPIRCVRE